jgi:hypothetical protein
MLWREARDNTLQQWTAIQDSIGQADPLDLLTDVNAVTAICEKAKEEAGGGLGKCDYCVIYQQFGSCKEFSGRLSEKIAEKDWQGVRDMVGTAINTLERLDVPDERKVAVS